MSKVDAMRALREAKYAATSTSTSRSAAAPASPRTPAARSPAARTPKVATPERTSPVASATEVASDRCGHRNMGGKNCTRDAGHAEKNHRYS